MAFKSGFVNIVGKPNVGKSTLMNALVGEKMAIVTAKAQTTRHRIIGIVNGEDFQIVFSDTPGIIKPNYSLQKSMMSFVKDAYEDADVLLILVEPKHQMKHIEPFEASIKKSQAKKILVLNKVDKIKAEEKETLLSYWQQHLKTDNYLAISALKQKGLKALNKQIMEHLPAHPPYYATDSFTDKPERFFMSEIIREKILKNYKEEIPYSVEVVVDSFKEEPKIIRISAIIYCNKKSHKPILIGKAGSMLKKVGTEARIDAEVFFGKKIFLQLFVKIKENWRDNDFLLKQMGYQG